MKKLISILIISGAITTTTMSQFDTVPTTTVIRYGFKMGNFNTGSGYNMGFEGSVFVESKGRLLALGFFYNSEKNRIAGITINHEIHLGKTNRKSGFTFDKFLFYNFLLVKSTLCASDISSSLFKSMYTNSNIYSMEHHIGIGCKLGLTNNIFINAAIGYGRYMGSVKKASQPSIDNPVFKGGNGWGTLTKINISYYL